MSVNITIKTSNMICTDISGASIDPIIQSVESVNGEMIQAIAGYRVTLLREGVGASESPRLSFDKKEEAEETYRKISEQIFNKNEEALKKEHYKDIQTASLNAVLQDNSLPNKNLRNYEVSDFQNKVDEVEIENEISKLIKDLEEIPLNERLGYAFTWLSGHSDDPWISNLASIFENKKENQEEKDEKSFISENEKDFVKSMIKQASVSDKTSIDSFVKNILKSCVEASLNSQVPKIGNAIGIPLYAKAINEVIEILKSYLKLSNTASSNFLIQKLNESSPINIDPTLLSESVKYILNHKESDELFMNKFLRS